MIDWSAPKLQKALDYAGNTHTVDDVRAAVALGDMQVWPGKRSVMITEVVQYPQVKAVRVFAGYGDMKELRQMEGPAASWATSIGCTRLEGFGRVGWLRALQDRGYQARVFCWKTIKA